MFLVSLALCFAFFLIDPPQLLRENVGCFGKTTQQIEKTHEIRKSNKDHHTQYGRLLFEGMHVSAVKSFCLGGGGLFQGILLDIFALWSFAHNNNFFLAAKGLFESELKLDKESVFLDIGHGIGNACLQAAYTFGCETRGIEVDSGRNDWASKFGDRLNDLLSIHGKRDSIKFRPGKVDLRVGELQDRNHRNFLVEGVDAVFVNNFNGVFSGLREGGEKGLNLDRHVAGLFALMKPGTYTFVVLVVVVVAAY